METTQTTQETGRSSAPMGEITWSKLRSGEWGVRGPASLLVPGARVDVKKRDGGYSVATVDAIVWTDGTIAIASTVRDARRTGGRRSARGARSAPRYSYRGRCEDAPCCGCCD